MSTPNLYEVLQVSPNADTEIIDAAYRRLARLYHPDVNHAPDAEERFKRINEAYSILSDTNKRRDYDRLRQTRRTTYPPPHPQATPTYSPPPPQPRTTYSPSYTPPKPTSSTRKSSSAWKVTIWIVVVILFYYFMFTHPSNNSSSSSTDPRTAASRQLIPTEDRYADCISWLEAEDYDGQYVCVYGRIRYIESEYDEPSGQEVWYAHFGTNPKQDLTLISVGRNISKWEGECVVVYGDLFDRERLKEYVSDAEPSMVDSDPFDDRGFTIVRPEINLCES